MHGLKQNLCETFMAGSLKCKGLSSYFKIEHEAEGLITQH